MELVLGFLLAIRVALLLLLALFLIRFMRKGPPIGLSASEFLSQNRWIILLTCVAAFGVSLAYVHWWSEQGARMDAAILDLAIWDNFVQTEVVTREELLDSLCDYSSKHDMYDFIKKQVDGCVSEVQWDRYGLGHPYGGGPDQADLMKHERMWEAVLLSFEVYRRDLSGKIDLPFGTTDADRYAELANYVGSVLSAIGEPERFYEMFRLRGSLSRWKKGSLGRT